MRKSNLLFFIPFLLLHAACTGNRHIPPGEKFYNGAEIKMVPTEEIPGSDLKETARHIREVFKLEPNVRVLGMRPKVWFYHLAGEVKKKKGFKYWLKYKVGEAPVYFSAFDISTTQELVENRLELNGFFHYDVTHEVDSSKHLGGVTYEARVSAPYRLDSIHRFQQDSSIGVMTTINGLSEESVLKRGDRYDFNKLRQERARIEQELRNLGYYYFDDRSILFQADTTIQRRKTNIYPGLKNTTLPKSLRKYQINNVVVNTSYEWGVADSVQTGDTLLVNNMRYVRNTPRFKPEAITSYIALRPDSYYSRKAELITLNRLIQLDVFRYVNVNFEETATGEMDAYVFLSPLKQNSIQFQVDAVGTSNDFVGPHINVSWLHRNIFKGAESYSLNIYTGYEWQIGGGGNESLNNYEFGLENVLTFPRLIEPFGIKYESARFLPETKIKLGAKFQRRVGFYQLNSVHADFGYEWKQTITKRHKFYPIVLNFIDLGNTTGEFDSLLIENPVLKRSFEEQFIVGASYGYYFSSLEEQERHRRHNIYFNANLDVSGNLLYGINNLFNAEVSSESGNYTILGQAYSQFTRGSLDFRYYWTLPNKSMLASRIITGVGYSYGNSVTMPYTYQYSVGGSNSLRGFRARSVGPGSFVPDSTITFIDQTGDIKLEFNLEYRFEIYGRVKGAIFTDVGNVWTLREDPERPGAEFRWDSFMSQLAADVGFGVRYDLDIFALRLDVGWPVKLAYEEGNERSGIPLFPMEFWKSNWRDEYLVWNIAIGYPF